MFAQRVQRSLDKIALGNKIENELYQSSMSYGKEKGYTLSVLQCIWKHYEDVYEMKYGHFRFAPIFDNNNSTLFAAHLIEKAAYCSVNTENYIRKSKRGMTLWK